MAHEACSTDRDPRGSFRALAGDLDHAFRLMFAMIAAMAGVGAAIAATVPKPEL